MSTNSSKAFKSPVWHASLLKSVECVPEEPQSVQRIYTRVYRVATIATVSFGKPIKLSYTSQIHAMYAALYLVLEVVETSFRYEPSDDIAEFMTNHSKAEFDYDLFQRWCMRILDLTQFRVCSIVRNGIMRNVPSDFIHVARPLKALASLEKQAATCLKYSDGGNHTVDYIGLSAPNFLMRVAGIKLENAYFDSPIENYVMDKVCDNTGLLTVYIGQRFREAKQYFYGIPGWASVLVYLSSGVISRALNTKESQRKYAKTLGDYETFCAAVTTVALRTLKPDLGRRLTNGRLRQIWKLVDLDKYSQVIQVVSDEFPDLCESVKMMLMLLQTSPPEDD